MLTREDILQYLGENKSAFFADFQLVKLGLFGSFAKGEATDNSDIDILVEFEPGTENLVDKKAGIKNKLQQRFNREVDICREKYIKAYFKSRILNSAIYV